MPQILVVADCPPSSDNVSFSSPSWIAFDDLLLRAGIDPSLVEKDYVSFRGLPEKWGATAKRKRHPNGYEILPDLNCWVPLGIRNEVERFKARLQSRPTPTVILAAGPLACGLLANGSLSNGAWAGTTFPGRITPCPVIPTLGPDVLAAKYEWRLFAQMDIVRASLHLRNQVPIPHTYEYICPQTTSEAEAAIKLLKSDLAETGKLTDDLETYSSFITTIGLSAKDSRVFVFPLSYVDLTAGESMNLWAGEFEEHLLNEVLQVHQQAEMLIGQNYLYDLQYYFRNLGFLPTRQQRLYDTMLAGHVLYPTAQKSLDKLARLNLPDYRFWKEDKKGNGLENNAYYLGTPELWKYNGDDVINTLRIHQHQLEHLKSAKLLDQAEWQFKSMRPLLKMMLRGTKIDRAKRSSIINKLETEIKNGTEYVSYVTNKAITNTNSNPQLKNFFYGALRMPEQRVKGRKGASCNWDALERMAKHQPIIKPLVNQINYVRTCRNLISTANMTLGPGGRAFTSYNPAGTETFRLSSRESAFGEGTNLQNQTKGNEKGVGTDWMPNMRALYVPDKDYFMWEGDLARADLYVVVWEADDEDLKVKLREGVDMHKYNAVDAFGLSSVNHVTDAQRQATKAGVHATNYGAQPRTLAATLGITVREAEAFQRRWFGAHPGIRRWQSNVEQSLQETRCIYNAFGYRLRWLGRIDKHAVDAALAWGPQSTVAIVTQRIMIKLDELMPASESQLLLQVHDSLNGQIRNPTDIEQIKAIANTIVVPYRDPLVIPFDVVLKQESWAK